MQTLTNTPSGLHHMVWGRAQPPLSPALTEAGQEMFGDSGTQGLGATHAIQSRLVDSLENSPWSQ